MLADRLKTLESEGIIGRSRDAENRRRYIYRLTKKGAELGPIIAEAIRWSARYDPMTEVRPGVAKRIKNDRERFLADMRARLKLD